MFVRDNIFRVVCLSPASIVGITDTHIPKQSKHLYAISACAAASHCKWHLSSICCQKKSIHDYINQQVICSARPGQTMVTVQAVSTRPAANGQASPSKETEKQIRALRTELALLKKRLEEMPMQLILPPADGDFAILASRPIAGYK